MTHTRSFRLALAVPTVFVALVLSGCAAGSYTGDGLIDGGLALSSSGSADASSIILPDSGKGLVFVTGSNSASATTTATSGQSDTEGSDAGGEGFDAGGEGFDAGGFGFDAGGEGFDAGGGGFDAGGFGFDAGAEPCFNPDDIMCSGTCINPNHDSSNCGGCGNACTGGGTCSEGVCSGGAGGGDSGTSGFSCAHSACTTGESLDPNCDDLSNLVQLVCSDLPQCCFGSNWGTSCVEDAQYYCTGHHGVDQCAGTEPGC